MFTILLLLTTRMAMQTSRLECSSESVTQGARIVDEICSSMWVARGCDVA